VLGKGLNSSNALKSFNAEQLKLSGEVGVVIPKGIKRLRLSGSGSRFVHGGATLQETIIPVISINKKRQSDTAAVEVDVLRGGTSVITSGQLSVTLYQAEAVTDKIQPRKLRVGLYTDKGKLISDSHDVLLDLNSENPREREMKLRFVLTSIFNLGRGGGFNINCHTCITFVRLRDQIDGTYVIMLLMAIEY